jgi:hypothetical protein
MMQLTNGSEEFCKLIAGGGSKSGAFSGIGHRIRISSAGAKFGHSSPRQCER